MFSKHQHLVSEMRTLVVDRDPTYRFKVGSYLSVNGFARVDAVNYHGLANTRLRRADHPILIVADVGPYYNSTWEIIDNMRRDVKTVAVLDASDVSNDDHYRGRRADAYVSRYAYLILLGHNILRAIDRANDAPARMAPAREPRVLSHRGAEVLSFRRSGVFA